MKKTLLTVWGIVFLLLVTLISLYFMLRPNPDPTDPTKGNKGMSRLEQIRPPFFRQPLDENAGRENVNAYRQNLLMRSYGVVYDADDILNYIKNVYPRLKEKMGRDTTGYTWKVGFYWMVTKGKDSMNRLGFCVVPTLVSKTDSTKRLDYFKDSLHYKRPLLRLPSNHLADGDEEDDDDGNVYDEGQLWP